MENEKKVEVTEQEMNRLLEQDRKVNRFKASHEKSQNKRKARIAIILAKAEKKGITCTDEEIVEWMKSH
jgi:ribosomal protein S24E